MTRRGRFVVIEGADATGKSTQVARLAARVREHGVEVVETFEPGSTEAGRAIRELLLAGDRQIAPSTEALLMAADRAQHVQEVVRPAVERGTVVVSDRYLPSSLVYQGVVRGLGADAIGDINRLATEGLEPDLVVVLDVADDAAEARRASDADRFEREGAGFQREVRRAYRELAEKEGWVLVDANGSIEEVAGRVWRAAEGCLE
ncbi:MAG: dTMP kinase [Acidimicrobiia bacterium]